MDLIDREKLKLQIAKQSLYFGFGILPIIMDVIKSQPSADIERHAHWEYDLNIYGEKIIRCSNCRDIFKFYEFQNYNYCSNCGCKMDEVLTDAQKINLEDD